jgi:predicted ATP-grasp superfamily ATP-dependent carboligase
MQIFIYEFLTGGGLWSKPEWGEPSGSLLREGIAMLEAIATDFADLPDTNVVILWDRRIERQRLQNVRYVEVNSANQKQADFSKLAGTSALTLVIAPEIENVLADRCEAVIATGGKLLGSDLEFVRLASDKYATNTALRSEGVRVPESFIVDATILTECPLPAVLKPRFGAGSSGVRRIETREELHNLITDSSSCIESFVPGRPASIAAIASEQSHVIFPPCWQHFRDDRHFEYMGGALIDDANAIDRARRLAQQVINAMPNARGYFGIDMVLGSSRNGIEDFVIEINPRLTTSYVGLRASLELNLAGAMLQIYAGESVTIPRPRLPRRF